MKRIILGVLLLFAMFTMQAQAVIVTFDYEGVGVPGGSGDATGATIVGQFGWETAIADTDPSDPRAEYLAAGFWRGAISGGPQDGLSFDTGSLDIRTTDNVYFGGTGDALIIYVFNLFPESAFSFVNLLDGGASDALGDTALPLDLDLADWNFETRLYIAGFDFGFTELPGTNQFSYDLTRVELHTSEIPLPASVYGFATAMLVLSGIGKLKRRRIRRK